MIPHSPAISLKRDRLSIVSLAIAKKRREGSLADCINDPQEESTEVKMLDDAKIDTSCIPKVWLEVGLGVRA